MFAKYISFNLNNDFYCIALDYVKEVLKECNIPLVIDADGINVMASHKDILRGRAMPTILTPHDGEFARLGPSDGPRAEQTAALARELGCIILRKGDETVITDGSTVYLNRTGNPGMATGGSGDVLTGILAGLTAQGMQGMEAVCMAVYLHGLAGNMASKKKTVYSVMAGDLLDELPTLFSEGGVCE